MEKTISPDSFAMLCFLVLMANGGGIRDKAPSYISEKMHLLGRGYEAFAALDIYNMRKVMVWCYDWNIEVPEVIQKEFDMQEAAMKELQEKGIEL